MFFTDFIMSFAAGIHKQLLFTLAVEHSILASAGDQAAESLPRRLDC